MRLDVWDFNPEETVNEKLNKIHQVKDGRGLRKFIKETLHATAGKISHELLGSVEIPLNNIPASGVSGWWNLEKPDTRRQKERGEIHLSLTLSSDKDQQLTSQEHRHLLKILFAHELQRSNVSALSTIVKFYLLFFTLRVSHIGKYFVLRGLVHQGRHNERLIRRHLASHLFSSYLSVFLEERKGKCSLLSVKPSSFWIFLFF